MREIIKSVVLGLLGTVLLTGIESCSIRANHDLTVKKIQTVTKSTLSYEDKLPFDKEVRIGKLDNGLKYFIRKNKEPEKRVTMYLAIKAGSILENEKQLGLAHFLEHMNFNGLKHFPKNELVDYLQKVGVSFGSDLNAYTSFDETVYQLPIPSDDPKILSNGLQIVRDWAQDALLTDQEIDKERGVVMEEMRGNFGVEKRMQEQYLPVILNNSLYSQRIPIGTEEIITTFPYDEVRKFHRDWYRPDLQSVIIVGDIDVDKIEKEVKRLFSDLKNPENKPPRIVHKIPLLNKNQFKVITDPEMTNTSVEMYIKYPEEKVKTIGDFRRELLKGIFGQMINNRLGELSQKATPPFMWASVGIGHFTGGLDVFSATLASKPGEIEVGFKALLRELERVKKHGFTSSEFERAIKNIETGNEAGFKEKDKTKSDHYVQRYLQYFLKDSHVFSNEDRYHLTKELLPTLTLKEAEEIGKQYYVENNRDILIKAPKKDEKTLPTETKVNEWIAEVKNENIPAYVDEASDLPLLSKQPISGTIVSEKRVEEIDAKELILSNGVKVVLKPTTLKNDEVYINGFSDGGNSIYGDEDYFTVSSAGSLVSSSGLGQLNPIEFRKYSTGKNVSVSPYIAERTEGISAYSGKNDLSTAFEYIYAYFTEPRMDNEMFHSIINRRIAGLANREDNPQFVFGREIGKTLFGDKIRVRPETEADIKSISKERALKIFKDRFADASDFTFIIVGSFEESEIRPLVEKYLASLPNLQRKEEAKDLGIYPPKKGLDVIVHKGKEPKANVSLSYFGDYDYNEVNNINMNALGSILTIKLTERLREEEGGVYGVGASASYSKEPRQRYSFSINFGTGDTKYKSLIKSTLEEIKLLKENGPSQENLDKFKIEQKRNFELSVKKNGFWSSYIGNIYSGKAPLQKVEKKLEQIDEVSIESVKQIANKYLKEDRLFKFILLPDEVSEK